jgi:tetratricopeptide (TPR) repeat protein
MYKKLLPVAFSCMLMSGMTLAQDINFEKVSFNYVRLPMQPLPKEAKTFSGKVELTYKDEAAATKSAREQEVADLKAKAAADQDEYKKKSLGAKAFNKLVLDEGKPKGAVIGKDPYIAKIHDTNVLANSYIQIPGYTRQNADADVQVTVMLNGFSMVDIAEKTKETKVKIGGAETSITKFYYEISYKHPITLRVQDKAGNIIQESPIESLNEASTSLTSEHKSKEALDKYWSENQNTILRALDEKIISANMNVVKDELASRYGFSQVPRATTVINIKDKKVSYDDYNQAFEKATTAYSKLASNEKKAEAAAELEKAVELWNNALKESDVKNKKARVDAKVTAATHLNCAEAYMWLNNFEEAEKHLNKIKMLDISKYETLAKDLNTVIVEQKSRFNNNNKM